jgi:hypothetical protein
VSTFVNYQRWIGIGLVILGIYYLFDRVLISTLAPVFNDLFQVDFYHWYYQYFQTTIVCILLIGGGIKLLSGSKKRSGGKQA